jgi:hypothetical protein
MFFWMSGKIRQKLLRILGRIRKIAKIGRLSLCPSVRLEQLGSHWTDFHEI